MHSSAPAGLWDPQPPFNHATPLPRPPAPPTTTSSASVTSTPGPPRRTRVTSAPPAKRITFYRSGDNQFGGIRMAIHGRSFKCFDALLDDLSQKVPLPFGVRTVTTPRGTRSIKHLEQLQDRACYLCSDRRQAKPVNMELAGKRPVLWQYQGRRPWAPAMAPPPPGHGVLRQRRILLVKNSEPGLRRSTVLSRRNTRSLKAFLDEASEVMQFHVRKLYTAEGRKIDSVQSLMTCPSVLVCAGREAFSAMLLDCSRKNSEGKLPGLGARTPRNGARSPATQASSRSPPNAARSTPRGARSRASDGSEGRESKKSVNFGLETKKSVIHRRSDSSNHRFSVSSDTEKLGLGCPMHHQARTAFGNDDIEKRVLVNKDGSLSVEMKVRFRLQNEETVQWSTQIRKSPPASLSSDPLKEDQPCYLEQGQSESCSDPDSASASCDPGVADYIGQSLRHPLEDDHCPCCCQRCQQQHYDLWENPAHSHKHPVAPPMHASRHTHSSSSSSSCRSRRVVRRRTRLSDSGSEQGRVVQEEEVCVTEEVQRKVEQSGDSCVEVCRISRCSSRSGRRSVEDSEERPPSAISNSSHVLQALQEDDDDEEEEENLPPSASQCCPSGEPSLLPGAQTLFTPRPPSNGSVGSARAAGHSKTPQCEEGGCIKGNGVDETDRATSSRSKTSRTSHRSTVVRTPNPEEEGAAADDEEEQRVLSSLSARSCSSSVCPDCGGCKRGSTPASCGSQAGGSCSRASHRSHHSHHSHTATADPAVPNEEAECEASGASDDSDGSASSMQTNRSNLTRQECFSALSNIPEGRPSSAMSHASNRSKHSPTPSGEPPPAESAAPEEEEEERAQSTTSAASHRSRRSHKSNCSDTTAAPDAEASGRGTEGEQEGENAVERAASAVSAKSNASAKSAVSHKSNDDSSPRATTPAANPADVEAETNDIKDEVRASSVLSTKSAKSAASKVSRVSRKSCCSHCGKVSPCPNGDDNAKAAEATGRDEEQKREEEEVMDGRAASTMSAKSNLSAKSSKSHKSSKALARSCSPTSEAADDGGERAASAMSARSAKSNISVGSAKSCMVKEEVGDEAEEKSITATSRKSSHSGGMSLNGETGGEKGEEMEVGDKTEGVDEHEERAASAISVKSARSNLSAKSSKSHKSTCKHTEIPTIETNGAEGGTDEVGETSDERAASAMSAKSKLSIKSSGSHKSENGGKQEGGEEKLEERSASAMSAKSMKSNVSAGKSVTSAVIPAEVPVNGGKQEGGEEKLEERSASAMSAKSMKSNVSAGKSVTSAVNPAEVPVIETTDADDEGMAEKERTPSSASTKTAPAVNAEPTGDGGSVRSKSALSAASASARSPSPSKAPTSRSPTCHEQSTEAEEKSITATSRKSSHCGGVSLNGETGGEKGEGEEMEVGDKTEGVDENEERAASAISVKSARSNLSAKSSKSHKSTCKHTEIPTIETNAVETTDADDEGMAEKERTPSSASTKTAPAVNAEPTGDGGSVRSKSVLSAASASARSPSPSKAPTSRSPTRHEQSTPEAAAASPSPGTPQTPKRQLLPGSEAGVRGSSALSVRSTASTRSNRSKCRCGSSSALQKMKKEEEEELESKREEATERAASVLSASLGVERPLSAASSGSVSLGLPEDRESVKSDGGRSESHTARSNLSAKSSKVKPVDIPTIETTGGNEEAMEGEMPTVERSASALSAKSNASAKSSRSHKSTSSYSKGQNISTSPAKTGKSTNYLNTPDNRTPSAMSSSSNKVRIKTPTRASPKPTTPVPGDSAAEILSTIKPSEGKGDATDENALSVSKSPNCLRPQSAGALSSRSDKKTPKESLRPKSAVATDDSNSNESGLSRSLSAADLLKETLAAGRPLSRQSKASEKSGASRRSEKKRQEEDLTPACLPNASLNEVVSDWLKNIPTNDGMLALGDELNGGGQQQGKETEVEHGEQVEKEVEEAEVEKVEEEEEAGDDVVAEEKSDAALPTADITSSHPASLFEGHSSVAVMKVLLGPTKGRCRSLPEVSPVYGRRLSTSAQGLLDCLTQLQLIEPGSVSDGEQPKDRDQRYFEIITLLQSLWLSKPKDKEAEHGQVSPPRSSSGVGMSSGSGGSGNNGIDAGDGTLLKATDNEAVSAHVADAGEGETEAGDTGEEKATVDKGTKGVEELTAELPELPTEPDGKEPSIPAERSPSPTCGEVMDSPKRSGAPSPSGKSPNGDRSKSPGDTEQDSPPGTTAGLPSAVLEAPLPKQPSQDPDPMWVLRLLKKLEKQFMNHYTDAMADFKVRWDLDDSLMLDTMIKELREEVSQRIQRSIGREVKKIQGRAGKAPRPPAEANLSRESTMTDRRRRMLKVMKNQSVKTGDSLSDDDTAGSYSDQRSDDDYCPCDACVRKKMAARPPKMHPAASAAPVMMAFDLRKILQAKKDPEPPPAASAAPVTKAFDLRKILQAKKDPEAPPPPPALSPDPADGNAANGDVQEEGNTLEVVQEEEEEGDEEVPSVETIPEEEEEQEEEKEETPTEEVEEVEAEEKAGETGEEGEEEEEEEEDDDVEKVEEDGGEGAAEEQCECQHPHETEGEGGEEEDGEGEADEESGDTSGPGDKTQGETSAEDGGEGTETGGEEEGRTSENDDGDQENVEGENEGEDEEEQQSEDVVENEEESTPVEEFTEGNTGASAEAEDEDEGDDDDDEQEKGVTDEDESGGEAASTQTKERGGVPVVCVTEGEEADGEDSDTGSKRPSEAGADESGCDGTAEDEGEKEAAGEEEEESEDVEAKQQQVNGLSHQYTRTSMESQPGSMEAIDTEPSRTVSPLHPVKSQETGPKMVAGVSRGEGVAGKGQRRSRSPARVKRRKPKGSDVDLDDLEV